MDIRRELARIQLELNAPKGQYNDFSNYSYRSCEDILSAVKPLLNGMTVTVSDEIVMLGDRFYVKATVTLMGVKDGGVSVSGWAREAQSKKGMDEAQITGAASSYARKYALNGLFAIDDTKDPDSMDNSQKTNKKVAQYKPTNQDWEWVNGIKAGNLKLEQIDDLQYRSIIKGLIK